MRIVLSRLKMQGSTLGLLILGAVFASPSIGAEISGARLQASIDHCQSSWSEDDEAMSKCVDKQKEAKDYLETYLADHSLNTNNLDRQYKNGNHAAWVFSSCVSNDYEDLSSLSDCVRIYQKNS